MRSDRRCETVQIMTSDVAFPEKYYSENFPEIFWKISGKFSAVEKYLPLIFISYRIILQMLLAHLGDYKCY